jgi:large subunit ribosomal protein L13
MKTYSTKASDIHRQWHLLDASGETLGRLATQIATLLKGKHKPIYAPHMDTGDFVVVVNASKVLVTGKKAEQKMYYHHSGYPGGLKSESFNRMIEKHPMRVIEHAVKGMLPHNRQGRAMLRRLKVYAGDTHPHQAQTGLKVSSSTSSSQKEGKETT